jgi:GNAT superfamily N-acetyltransferase
MRASEFITEAFDKPYAFNWDSSYYGNYGVYVKLPDGNSLTISFYNEDKDNDVWHVAFARGYSQEVTGEGDAQRIFATVLHAIQQFIGKVHPEKLYFSASKKVEPGQNSESRAKLYSRMVKRYASSMGYDAVTDDFGRDSVTYILNKKQGVTEGESRGGIDLEVTELPDEDQILITATSHGKTLGRVYFDIFDSQLVAADAEVASDYRGQGIAAIIYDYAKELGWEVVRSGRQTDAGAGFWDKHRPKQDVWEDTAPTMGINVRSDGNIDYASLIVDGKKKYESRQTDSLRPYVGKTVAIVRTGKGPAVAIGQVTVGEPIVVDAQKFDKMRKQHLVPQGSKFDIGIDATKYLYPMINPVRWDNEKLVKQKGIVARKIDEDNIDDNIKLTHSMSPDMLYVHASHEGSDAGGARFKNIDGVWTGDIVHVYPQFRRQGIATKMYNYAEDLVGKIVPSKTLKPKGKKFWASRV